MGRAKQRHWKGEPTERHPGFNLTVVVRIPVGMVPKTRWDAACLCLRSQVPLRRTSSTRHRVLQRSI